MGKIKRSELCFFVYFGLFFTALFLEDIAFENASISYLVKGIKAFVALLLGCTALNRSWRKKELLKVIGVTILGLVVLCFSGDFFWIVVLLMGFVSSNVEEKAIFKSAAIFMVSLCTMEIILYAAGILPDVLSYRTDFSSEGRHSLGFIHSTVLPLCLFYLSTYVVMIIKNRNKTNLMLITLNLASMVLYSKCGSRNAFLLMLLLTLFTLSNQFFEKYKYPIVINWVAKHIGSLCCLLSILPGMLRYMGVFSSLWYAYDVIFTNRSLLAASAIDSYGLHFLNPMNYTDYMRKSVYVDSFQWSGIVLDSAYMYILIRYGVLVLIVLWMIIRSMYSRYEGNYEACLVVILVAIANITDNDLLSYGALPFMLVGIRYMWNFSKQRKLKIRSF